MAPRSPVIAGLGLMTVLALVALARSRGPALAGEAALTLPTPTTRGGSSLAEALAGRRSCRAFAAAPLTTAEVGQLLWAAQGVNRADGGRTAPSAGALYPLELYLVAGRVEGLAPGTYHYLPRGHRLERRSEGDARRRLADAAGDQAWVADAAAVLVLTAVAARTEARYGERAARYVPMEAGHAGQNACLQATALGLGSVVVGAFDDRAVQRVLALPADHRPLALLPVGRPR